MDHVLLVLATQPSALEGSIVIIVFSDLFYLLYALEVSLIESCSSILTHLVHLLIDVNVSTWRRLSCLLHQVSRVLGSSCRFFGVRDGLLHVIAAVTYLV